jgi:hypothetical protein
MPKPTNRRTFLKGTAGAVGVGAVGALATKLKLGAASLSANPQEEPPPQRIPVYLVPNGGKKQGMSVLVPPAWASAGDDVEWEPMGDNIERIIWVQFKDRYPDGVVGIPNPFSTSNRTIRNPNSGEAKMRAPVLADAAIGTYNYRIMVQPIGGGAPVQSDDPPLDIVPSG